MPVAAAASKSGLATGNYTVGYCVRVGDGTLNDNDWVNGWVIVTN